MNLTNFNVDSTDFVTAGRALQKLVLIILTNLIENPPEPKYQGILHDFSTLFCIVYKSFFGIVDITYLLNGYQDSINAVTNGELYYKYFNQKLKPFFLLDFDRLKKVFSKTK